LKRLYTKMSRGEKVSLSDVHSHFSGVMVVMHGDVMVVGSILHSLQVNKNQVFFRVYRN
jgi:hypothetical protein